MVEYYFRYERIAKDLNFKKKDTKQYYLRYKNNEKSEKLEFHYEKKKKQLLFKFMNNKKKKTSFSYRITKQKAQFSNKQSENTG